MKIRIRFLLLCTFSWALDGCSGVSFRHYDPLPNCLPSTKYETFSCKGPAGDYGFQFKDARTNGLVCFPREDFLKHEVACHSK